MKRSLTIFLTLALVFSLGACSGTSSNSAEQPKENSKATSGNTAAPAPVNWPGKDTVTVVVPYGAGGDTDFNARLIFEKVQGKLGGNFIIQNVSGNSGAVGAQSALESDPDGKTILFYHTAMLLNQATGLSDFGYTDFDICCIAADKDNGCYYMRTDNPYGITDFNSLVEYTTAHPEELTLTYTAGGTTHLAALQLQGAGVKASLVDVGGKSECLAALLGGQIDITPLTYTAAKEYVDNGEFFAVGYMNDKENPLIDSDKYPALIKYGVTSYWPMDYFIAFPKGTDPQIISLLSDTVSDIVANDKDYANKIAQAYYEVPTYYNAQDSIKIFSNLYDQVENYADLLKGN